jgi:polyisoprenoid-binding protein YceI
MTTATAPTTVTTWQIDPAHSSVEFAVRHLMISTVRGRFGSVSGTVKGLDGGTTPPELDVSIDVSSIDTRQSQRDEHLRSADFFDAAKFPTITFRARRVDGDIGKSFRLVGDLTIRGVTREVALDVESQGRGADPWGGYRAGFSATGKLDRRDFGLTWNQLLEAGGFAVGDEIKLTVDAELTRQAA